MVEPLTRERFEQVRKYATFQSSSQICVSSLELLDSIEELLKEKEHLQLVMNDVVQEGLYAAGLKEGWRQAVRSETARLRHLIHRLAYGIFMQGNGTVTEDLTAAYREAHNLITAPPGYLPPPVPTIFPL